MSILIAFMLKSPIGCLIYLISYCSMYNVIRFFDCFSHTYDVFQKDEMPKDGIKRNKKYDLEHTFSVVFAPGKITSIFNLISLNFGFHNAHHYNTSIPWFSLPTLHENIPVPLSTFTIDPIEALKQFHTYRIYRLYHATGKPKIRSDNTLDLSEYFGIPDGAFMTLEI